jgi:hypothetical protein
LAHDVETSYSSSAFEVEARAAAGEESGCLPAAVVQARVYGAASIGGVDSGTTPEQEV